MPNATKKKPRSDGAKHKAIEIKKDDAELIIEGLLKIFFDDTAGETFMFKARIVELIQRFAQTYSISNERLDSMMEDSRESRRLEREETKAGFTQFTPLEELK